MKRTRNRFLALTIIFVSIMSFLPIKSGLNGRAVNAITTQIQVSGTSTQTGDKIISINGEYSTQQKYKDFTLSVDYKKVDKINIPIGEVGVVDQEVIITSIDGIKLNGDTLAENNAKLAIIGCSISDGKILTTDDNNNKKIGATITELPYGVNKIEYRIKETTVFNKGQKDPSKPSDSTSKINDFQDPIDNYFPSSLGTKEIIIQHANGFVQGKVSPMVFDSYVGNTMAAYIENKNPKDNKFPFLFTEEGKADVNCPLRYNFKVSDAVLTLKYTMTFNGLTIGNVKILKNGIDYTGNV